MLVSYLISVKQLESTKAKIAVILVTQIAILLSLYISFAGVELYFMTDDYLWRPTFLVLGVSGGMILGFLLQTILALVTKNLSVPHLSGFY